MQRKSGVPEVLAGPALALKRMRVNESESARGKWSRHHPPQSAGISGLLIWEWGVGENGESFEDAMR